MLNVSEGHKAGIDLIDQASAGRELCARAFLAASNFSARAAYRFTAFSTGPRVVGFERSPRRRHPAKWQTL
jgi:hypothetical protein